MASEKTLSAPLEEMHGFLGDKTWDAPRLAVECELEARPGYQTRKAHEYLDTPSTLAKKIATLASLITQSTHMLVYTGAGISTSSGIGDYATKAADESVAARPKLMSPIDARPTKAHLALTALHAAGHVKHWVQQNHDGLPQKAGFPQHCLNEIHGAWYDVSNPVVKMSGDLRSDLFQWLLEWEEKTDLCLAMGTSLCGMNADRVVTTVGKAGARRKKGRIGSVIVNLQQTQHDDVCALRIFAPIDEVMERVAAELAVTVPADGPDYKARDCHVFENLPYNSKTGVFDANASTRISLEDDSRVRVTAGPYKGCEGTVQTVNRQGHYKIVVTVPVNDKLTAPSVRILGRWWMEEAGQGRLPFLPVVQL